MRLTTLAVSVLAFGTVIGTLAQQTVDGNRTEPSGLAEDDLNPLASNEGASDITSMTADLASQQSAEKDLGKAAEALSSPVTLQEKLKKPKTTYGPGIPLGSNFSVPDPKESIMGVALKETCVKILRDQFDLEKLRTCFGLQHTKDRFSERSYIQMYNAGRGNPEDLSGMESYVSDFGDQYCSRSASCDVKELQTLRDMLEDTDCQAEIETNGWLGFIHQYTMTFPLLQKSFCTEGPLNVLNVSRPVGRCGAWTAKKLLTASIAGEKDYSGVVPSVGNLMELFMASESTEHIHDYGVCDVCIPIYGRQADVYKLAAHKNKQFADLSTTFLGDKKGLEEIYKKNCPKVVIAHIQGYGAASMTLSQLGKTGLALTSLVMAGLAWL